MRRFLLASAVAAIACGSPAFAQDNAERIAAAALEAAPVWDGHNDVSIQLRSRVGNVINDFLLSNFQFLDFLIEINLQLVN